MRPFFDQLLLVCTPSTPMSMKPSPSRWPHHCRYPGNTKRWPQERERRGGLMLMPGRARWHSEGATPAGAGVRKTITEGGGNDTVGDGDQAGRV